MATKALKPEHQRLELTDESVAALPLAATGRGYIARDTVLTGFQCTVGRRTKTLVYSGEHVDVDGKRTTIYKRLGDPTLVPVSECRARANEEVARIARMTKPDAKAGLTLKMAWADQDGYLARLKKLNRSPRTIDDYTARFDAHLAGLHNKPLKDIRRADAVRLHEKLTADAGPYQANGVNRVAHAIFRHAMLRMEVPGLGANPFAAMDLNPEKPRQTGMSERDLKPWFDKVAALQNPVRRELQMALLLTGLTRTDLTDLPWAHVHPTYIDFPDPAKRRPPSRVPITPPLRRCLDRVKKAAETFPERCHVWVFPSLTSASGHITEPKEDGLDKSPHALRHTYRGMCEGAKVSKTLQKLLMLHVVSGDVHDDYMTIDSMFDQLATAANDVAGYIIKHLPRDWERRLRETPRPE